MSVLLKYDRAVSPTQSRVDLVRTPHITLYVTEGSVLLTAFYRF